MPCFRLASACVALLLFASFASAQQGAASYGQQGGQGGFGGSRGGGGMGGGGNVYRDGNNRQSAPSADEVQRSNFPDSDERQGVWTVKSAILTPGDQYQIKLKLKKGETVLAGVISDAFDPALELDDAKGAALAKNDDRADGEQSPYISYRVPSEDTYTLKVLSYRSISGGKFTIRMRTFVAMDSGTGNHKIDVSNLPPDRTSRSLIFRLNAKKGTAYDLAHVTLRNGRNYFGTSSPTFFGPTGYRANDFLPVIAPYNKTVFVALQSGDYYFEYEINRSEKYDQVETEFNEVKTEQTTANAVTVVHLVQGELRIIDMDVKPGQVVKSSITGSDSPYTAFFARKSEYAETESGSAQNYADSADWLWLRTQKSSNETVVRSFHTAGTFRLVVMANFSGRTISIKNSESLEEWKDAVPLKESLQIGESKVYLLKSKQSELMHVMASADHFEPKLEIFNLDGQVENTLINTATHKPSDDLYFPKQETFLIRLSCDGDGGSGEFDLSRKSPLPEAYKLGSAQRLDLTGQNFGYYSIELEKGKQYELLYDHTEMGLRADLLDDDGTFLTSQYISFGSVGVQYFTPNHPGHYRLWLRGGPGVRTFKFRVHAIPTLKD